MITKTEIEEIVTSFGFEEKFNEKGGYWFENKFGIKIGVLQCYTKYGRQDDKIQIYTTYIPDREDVLFKGNISSKEDFEILAKKYLRIINPL